MMTISISISEEEASMLDEAAKAVRLTPNDFLRLQIHAQYMAMKVLAKLHSGIKSLRR